MTAAPSPSQTQSMFTQTLAQSDPELYDAIGKELGRQRDEIELIASENIVSRAVLEAQGSVLTNKYAEGLPGKRYYGGCQYVDIAETLAIERAKKLFGCNFVNVQPHSGASANAEVFFALLQPGDTFMGLNLAAGGHLSHGMAINMSGKWFKPVPYNVRREDQRIDMEEVEKLAIERAPRLFGCTYANVQPNSGSQANQGVFMALMQPGDTFMGLDLAAGGHLTHGAPVNQSGKWFNVVSYGVCVVDQMIDYDAMERLAVEHKPKMIVAGGSAYARHWDFARFREIADSVGALLMVDMAHFAGLVAGGAHPSPFPHAHVVTTTTHKTLRGPRGGMILTNDEDLAKKLNSAVFPGMQGGPLMHVIAAKAVAFGEALRPSFKTYAKNVVENARALAETLKSKGYDIVSGGTDTHLMLVDLRPKRLTGKVADLALGRAHITCNKNGIPFDPEKPTITSGIRLGTPAGTTRGFGIAEFQHVGELISEVLDVLSQKGTDEDSLVEAAVRDKVKTLLARFPIYQG